MKSSLIILLIFCSSLTFAKEYHVSKSGKNENTGTENAPFLRIQAAAEIAAPGDVITVHAGTYREKIIPVRGGLSNAQRITYRAADGEEVLIKGSEQIKGWKKHAGTTWKVTLPNSFFGAYNPYKEIIEGDWFNDHGRIHHTGEVFLNGKSFWEVTSLEQVLNPVKKVDAFDPEGSLFTWYCESDEEETTIYANFHGAKPNKELVEISVRNSCFYPAQTGINFITISGFQMSQAATNWAAPTAEQVGLIGTFWSKGWIIENNMISDSKCSGITLGKDRKSGHNAWSKEKTKGGATIYNEVVLRVIKDGWSKEKIGSHIVRNNTIFNCEQTGICGSFGAAFSEVYGNHIYNIWRKRQFSGAEIGAIKFHGAIDAIIRNNCLHDAYRGMWLDWMTQGTRVSSNLCYHNDFADLFLEVNHGPYLVDNNIFLSGIHNWSQGGAFIHNLIGGKLLSHPVANRYTPYHFAHSTELMGFGNIRCGDDRYYNNIFLESGYDIGAEWIASEAYGLQVYEKIENALPVHAECNLYYGKSKPLKEEKGTVQKPGYSPKVEIMEEDNQIFMQLTIDSASEQCNPETITTQILGKSLMTHTNFENPDGTPLKIDHDFFGEVRGSSPMVGPFEHLKSGTSKIKVWQK